MIKKYFSIFALLISIILLSYTFFKSEIIHNGAASSYYLKYYIISIIFILLSLISFYLSEQIKINISITTLSVLIFSIFFEIYLFFTFQRNYHEAVYYLHLKKKEPNVYLKVYPRHFFKKENIDLFPLSVMSNKTIVGCKESDSISVYKSDRYGFNNPDKEWDNNFIDFLLLGDSFVHGNCVNENYSISGNLRKLLNKNKEINSTKGVLNIGQPASGPLIQLAILKEYYMKRKVIKNLIWIYYEQNDFYNLSEEIKNPILKKYLLDSNYSQNLINKNLYKDELVTEFHNEITEDIEEFVRINLDSGHSLISNIFKLRNIRKISLENEKLKYFLLRMIGQTLEVDKGAYVTNNQYPKKPAYHEFSFEIRDSTINEFKKIVKQIKIITDNNNTNLFFVYLPSLYRIENNKNLIFNQNDPDSLSSPADDLFRFKTVYETIKSMDIVFIDLNKELFVKEKNHKKYYAGSYRSHYNKKGYKKVSEVIYSLVNEVNKK